MTEEKKPAKFVTVEQAVNLLADASGEPSGDAAARLLDALNDAADGGRPALFVRDGAARKAANDIDAEYAKIINALDVLRRGRPADDRNDPYANYLRSMRSHTTGRLLRTGYDEYPGRVAVLGRLEFLAGEFWQFMRAAVSANPSSPPRQAPPVVADPAEAVPGTGRRHTPTVKQAIAPYVAMLMRERPEYSAEELYRRMKRDAGEDESPFSRLVQGGELFCVEPGKPCGIATVRAALTAYRKSRSSTVEAPSNP